jgi:hypothetical protein
MQSGGGQKPIGPRFLLLGVSNGQFNLLVKRHGKSSIASTMHFRVLVVGDRVGEAKGVFAGAGIELVKEYRVGGVIVLGQFQFRVAHNHFAIFRDAEFVSHLHNNFHLIACGHVSLPIEYVRIV